MAWREFRPHANGVTGLIVEHTVDPQKNPVTATIDSNATVQAWESYIRHRYDLKIYGAHR